MACNNNCKSNCNQCDECCNLSQQADRHIIQYWSEQYHSFENNWKPKKCVCPPFGTNPKYFIPVQVPCNCNKRCWCNNKCCCNMKSCSC